MNKWTESELKWYLETLKSGILREVAGTLWIIGEMDPLSPLHPVPTGNTEVITYLEKLIGDRRWCLVDLGIYKYPSRQLYGELRWLAARVLACEYAYLGVEELIVLEDVVQPIFDIDIHKIGVKHQLSDWDALREQGFLPAKTEIINPKDWCQWCSKEAIKERVSNQDADK